MTSLKNDEQHDGRHYEILNDFLDGIAEGEERETMLAHLSTCTACENLLKELRSIRREARTLPKMDPPERAWAAIADKIAAPAAASDESATVETEALSKSSGAWPARLRLLATAAVLLLGFALGQIYRANQGPPADDSEVLVSLVTEELRLAESHYQNAITGLEQIVEQNHGELPPELSSVLDANLNLIESAIVESRTALATEPESTVAQESLLEALRRKVGLLQSTILLINEVRKGEGESALDLIDELRDQKAPSNPI